MGSSAAAAGGRGTETAAASGRSGRSRPQTGSRTNPAGRPDPGWTPLPPPRKNRLLLTGTAAALVVWLIVLAYLALAT